MRFIIMEKRQSHFDVRVLPPGGEGGTQIWFRRGCAAEAAKPVPIFKGHFGGKGYLFIQSSLDRVALSVLQLFFQGALHT